MTGSRSQYDVAVVGGGPIGTTLAIALDAAGVAVALIEATDSRREAAPGYDGRTTALANSSYQILTTLGLWPALEPSTAPIHEIHVSEAGRFAVTRIEAEDEGVPALGYTAENRELGSVLSSSLRDSSVTVVAPATLLDVAAGPDEAVLKLMVAGQEEQLRSRLVVGADGVRSTTRAALGLKAEAYDYGQSAIVATVETSQLPEGRAFERFLPTGPLALLPGRRRQWGLVWTLPPALAAETAELPEPAFCRAVQRTLGFRAGRFVATGPRSLFPLARTLTRPVVGDRGVLVGSAANNLHPVAGQGFNLGLRDVAVLAELVHAEVSRGGDPGQQALLEAYVKCRREDHRVGAEFTHGLIELFKPRGSMVQLARQAGLLAFDLLPATKGFLARYAMGRSGWQPRLIRGVPLS